MTECFIYDTVRTPRGKGRKDGALHEVTALELGTQVLKNIRDRNGIDDEPSAATGCPGNSTEGGKCPWKARLCTVMTLGGCGLGPKRR